MRDEEHVPWQHGRSPRSLPAARRRAPTQPLEASLPRMQKLKDGAISERGKQSSPDKNRDTLRTAGAYPYCVGEAMPCRVREPACSFPQDENCSH